MDFSKLPIIGGIFGWLEEEDVNYGIPVLIIGFVIFALAIHFSDISQNQIFAFLFATAPLWLLYTTFSIFFYVYMVSVGKKFSMNNGRKTFEVKLPQEVFKSPEAMENVLTQMYSAQTPDNLMDTYLGGKRPLAMSFELVSRGGDVKFYVNLPAKKAPEAFLANMYAQYPGVEIIEQELDYTAEIPNDLKGKSFMSFHISKKKDQEFPIKTYIDLGLDKLPKEEEKSDPMTPLLEVLASVDANKQVWVQFLCVSHREKNFKNGQLKSAPKWEEKVYKKIDKLMKRDSNTKAGEVEYEGMPRLTTGERETVDAMERNASKFAFNFVCRWVYISNKEKDYDGAFYQRMIRTFASWEIIGRNGLGVRWRTDFNYNFLSDPFGKKMPSLKKAELKEYKTRKLYPKSGAMSAKILTTEEIATLWHLPGQVAMTPTLNRVPSTRGEAPSNLPTGNLPT